MPYVSLNNAVTLMSIVHNFILKIFGSFWNFLPCNWSVCLHKYSLQTFYIFVANYIL